MASTRTRVFLVALYLVAVFLVTYLPVVGQGFVADDFGWIRATQPSLGEATMRTFGHAYGFYRPLVNLSFGINYEFAALDPRPYGLVNLALLLVAATLVGWLANLMGLSARFALLAAGLFMFNPHGVDMAVLWVSGRTGLLLTVFSLGAAVAFLYNRPYVTAALTFCALFSKEEAVALPVVFLLWAFFDARSTRSDNAISISLRRTKWLWIAVAVYAGLRLHSGAIWPTNAPWYYRFSADPHLLIRNVREYADRACSLSLIVLLAVFVFVRSRPSLTPRDRLRLCLCLTWLCGGFALTIFLPVRSSLYALFPSVGAAIFAGIVVQAWWSELSVVQKRVLVTSALIVPLALFPIYRARGGRWITSARLSSQVTTDLVNHVATRGEIHSVVLQDDRSTRANLANAFGPAAMDVASLYFDRPVNLRIEPGRVEQVAAGEMLLVLDGRTGHLRRGN